MGYDYHNGDTRKYGNSNLFRRLDKDNITSQSTVSIVIGTGNICRDKMVCERLAGNKGILLKHTIPFDQTGTEKIWYCTKYYLYVCRNSFQHPFHYNIFMG